MKINLAENMLRFGVKNLNESSISKVKTLAEQETPAETTPPTPAKVNPPTTIRVKGDGNFQQFAKLFGKRGIANLKVQIKNPVVNNQYYNIITDTGILTLIGATEATGRSNGYYRLFSFTALSANRLKVDPKQSFAGFHPKDPKTNELDLTTWKVNPQAGIFSVIYGQKTTKFTENIFMRGSTTGAAGSKEELTIDQFASEPNLSVAGWEMEFQKYLGVTGEPYIIGVRTNQKVTVAWGNGVTKVYDITWPEKLRVAQEKSLNAIPKYILDDTSKPLDTYIPIVATLFNEKDYTRCTEADKEIAKRTQNPLVESLYSRINARPEAPGGNANVKPQVTQVKPVQAKPVPTK